jgi:uncharacterized protein (TIGR02391 family)
MSLSLLSLVPSADDLLALEVEELAGVLLAHLSSLGSNSGDSIVNQGSISQHNFFNNRHQHPEYGDRQAEVSQALIAAWTWLENEGFLVRDPLQQSPSFSISVRAQALKTREDFAAYRKANLLPKALLHPLIASKVYPAFLRGEYDTAVFQAFREVEVAVRAAGKFPADRVGVALMREAFRPVDVKGPSSGAGPLTDQTLPSAEQEGMAHLFSGAIALYKNPQSHRNVPTNATDAAEVIGFASHLLRTVDRLKPM